MENIFRITETKLKEAEDSQALDALKSDMAKLETYYTGPLWKADLAIDEEYNLTDIKRGVLSEDGIYNLLEQYKEKREEANE